MNKVILLGLLLAAGTARATTRPTPADTLPGQAALTHRLSASICQHLGTELPAGQDVGKLSAEECQVLLQKLTVAALDDNRAALQTVLKQARSDETAEAVGKDMSLSAMMNLVRECPSAAPLIMRMGVLSSGMKEAPDAAERNVLLPIVQALCKRLDEANARQPLAKRPPAEVNTLMETELQGAILAHSADLSGYYGEEVMDDEEKSQQIGEKIGLLMLEQCPSYLLLVNQGAATAQSAPAPAATPARPKPRPAAPAARKVPAKSTTKRPVKK